MARTKQTTRCQSKEDLRRIDELHGRPNKDNTDPIPDTPASTDTIVPTAVPPTAGISTLVTTITTTGPTSITTIIDNTGTTTTTIISTVTVIPGINIESRDGTPAAVASTQQVIDIESDSSDDEVEIVRDSKRLKTDKY
jgi:hypothetical protein